MSLGTWRSSRFARPIRDGLVVAGLVYFVYRFVVIAPALKTVGADAYAYWALDTGHPYTVGVGALGAFVYPPPAIPLFGLASSLSWPAFWWLWSGLLVATVLWLGWRRTLLVLAFPPVALELYYGNINLLIAAAIVIGFRYPVAWVLILLTKVTPGVGLVWFAVRREWRSLAIAIGVTAVVVAVSVAVDASLWSQWLGTLTQQSAPEGDQLPIPLVVRVPLAAVLVAWGGLTDRRWTVPLAAVIALPVIWVAGFSILAAWAAPRMWRPATAPG